MATGVKGLQVWCKNVTHSYGLEIKNMTSSWKDGLAFCAILHRYRPDLIDYNQLSKENVAHNNALAFRVAEDEFGIPALLDVEDMVQMKVPDRLSIMTYVSQYYHYFKDKVPGEVEPCRIPSKKRPLTEHFDPIPAKKGIPLHQGKTDQSTKSNACFSCGKTVYLMERFSIEGKLFHRICFKCTTCGTQLKTSTYQYAHGNSMFYCDKHFKDRDKTNSEPQVTHQLSEMKEHASPEKKALKNIQEDTAMQDDTVPSSEVESPFIRNQQFLRKGIHPHSSPADMDWEKVNRIKSKDEEHKSPVKTKPAARSFLFNVIKKKDSNERADFANPSYQQQLELSNFMHTLDKQASIIENNKNQVVKDSYLIEDNESQCNDDESNKLDTLSGVQVLDPVISDNISKFSGGVEGEDTESKLTSKGLHKKKFALKVKKKKKGDKKSKNNETIDNEKMDGNKINESCDVVKEPHEKPYVKADFPRAQPSSYIEYPTYQSPSNDYESIDNFINSKSTTSAAATPVIYDDSNLCQAITDKEIKKEPAIYNVLSSNNNINNKTDPEFVSVKSRLCSTGRLSSEAENTTDTLGDSMLSSPDVQLNTHISNEYLDIRSNLRKGKSVENLMEIGNKNSSELRNTYYDVRINLNKRTDISIETFTHDNKNNAPVQLGNAYKDVRAHLKKTNKILIDTVDSDKQLYLQEPSDIKKDANPLEQALINAKSCLYTTNNNNETSMEQTSGVHEAKNDVRKYTTTQEQVFRHAKLGLHETSLLQSQIEDEEEHIDTSSQNKLQTSPLKIEKKNTIKLKAINTASPSKNIPNLHRTHSTENMDIGDVNSTNNSNKTSKEDVEELNPFITPESSPTLARKTLNTNPFLSSTEDLLFEEDSEDEFDESNPFAEDARIEHRNTLRKCQSKEFEKNAQCRKSAEKKKNVLTDLGIDDSNPFADDLLDESDDEAIQRDKLHAKASNHVPEVQSQIKQTGNKKLILKNKKGQHVHRPTPSPNVHNDTPVPKQRSIKRAAPKPPVVKDMSKTPALKNVPIALPRHASGKKKAAPTRPDFVKNKTKENEIKSTAMESDKSPINLGTPVEATPHISQLGDRNVTINDTTEALEHGKQTVLISDDVDNMSTFKNKVVEHICNSDTESTEGVADTVNILDSTTSEHILVSEHNGHVAGTPSDTYSKSDGKAVSDSPKPPAQPPVSYKHSEKRKAPVRPPAPHVNMDEHSILENIALRDRQPKREEMDKELQFLEIRQRELEMEGVVMEKKLRENNDSEPEEAYLITWFELVNQKNKLLRRENELIYMCQELDLLQDQRLAEFQLRQLMMKPESDRTLQDKLEEDRLLANILKFVTRRSNIVDRMDEDRLREYEEDQEIAKMMETKGFASPHAEDSKANKSVDKKKEEKKKIKEKKKEKLRKKK